MKALTQLAIATSLAAGMILLVAPGAQAAPVDLGRVDFGCDITADDIYGDLEIVGSNVYIWGAIGDTFTIDEDNSDDCLVLNASGSSVNTVGGLGGFISESPTTVDHFGTSPLRISNSDTIDLVINGPGTFKVEALDHSVYTFIVNGGVASGDGRDLTVWQQAIGRGSANDTCPDGFTPSWAEWPHGGQGGFVCVKSIYAYYPNEPVS